MASACVNNIGAPPDNFLTMGWLTPRLSFSRDKPKPPNTTPILEPSLSSPPPSDFEFHLDNDQVTMLPADQLFSNGKLIPLHLSNPSLPPEPDTLSPEKNKVDSLMNDPYLFSPRAPRCSSRWRELLGFKKTNKSYSTSSTNVPDKIPNSSSSRSIRHFLQRSPKMRDPSLSLPLLKDSSSSRTSLKSDSLCSLSRLSLSSSSSSGHDHDELPRLSLDEKPRVRPVRANRVKRVLLQEGERETRVVSMDSPRMNPSGKIIYQGLERSSSSPSSLNGGPRYKHRVGIERSYSANVVRVTNVPVCSLRGSSKSGGVFGFGRNTGGKNNHYCHNRRRESS